MVETEALFSAVLDTTSDAVMVTDRAGIIRRINPAFEKLTGFASGTLVGKDARELFRDINDPEFCEELWEHGTAPRNYPSVRSKHSDGRAQVHALNMTPISDTAGQPSQFIAVILSESFQTDAATGETRRAKHPQCKTRQQVYRIAGNGPRPLHAGQ